MECVDYLIEVAGGDCDRVAALLTAFLQKEVRVPFKIISNAGTTIHISTGTAGFGEALAWVFVNRPIGATVTFRTSASASGAVNTDAVAFVAPSPSVEADLDGVQVVTTGQAIPSQCIDLFHLHCHFDEATEAAAQRLLGSTITAIEEGGERACHSHVWHERNGPHVGWSWELWVDNPSALGLGVRHMLLERSGLDPRLRCMVHCDTDQVRLLSGECFFFFIFVRWPRGQTFFRLCEAVECLPMCDAFANVGNCLLRHNCVRSLPTTACGVRSSVRQMRSTFIFSGLHRKGNTLARKAHGARMRMLFRQWVKLMTELRWLKCTRASQVRAPFNLLKLPTMALEDLQWHIAPPMQQFGLLQRQWSCRHCQACSCRTARHLFQ